MWLLSNPRFNNTRVYEGTDTRAGSLLLGAALAIWLSTRKAKGKTTTPSRALSAILGFLGVGGIIVMILLVDQHSYFLYTGGIAVLSIFTLCAIVAVLGDGGLWPAILGCPPMRWIGERSYAIYL